MEDRGPTKQEKKFALKIKKTRKNLGYSLEEAAKRIGIS
ncbi:DNA-binding XRE family transcriptional regulator [Fusobacterium sp. PH5-44]